jgi:DNA helicase-2/ATP-dependent DNA helicase PcrA
MVALVDELQSQKANLRIRFLTFTRAATAELTGKLVAQGDVEIQRPSTIHSFSISVLLRNPGTGGFPEPLRIADSWESTNLVRPSLARKAGVSVRTLDKLVAEMAANWQSLAEREDTRVSAEDRARFLGAWDEHRQIYGYTLLDELPYALRRALRDHDDLEGLDFDLLVVDEYQDLNACDLEVLRLLNERTGCSIIACGDDDQSIYSQRKAAPEGIRRFLTDYPGAADYPLSVTLRCGQRIIDWANHVIEGDPSRPPGRVRLSCRDGSPEGTVALLSFPEDKSEARGIAALARGLIKRGGLDPSDILILMRTDYRGTFSKPIKDCLQKEGVPCSDPDHVLRLLEEPANRCLLERLRLAENRTDPMAWAALLHLTNRVGEAFFNYIYDRCVENGATFADELLAAYNGDFPGGPAAATKKARDLIQQVLVWLDTLEVPEDRPDKGWGTWIADTARTGIGPRPTEEFVDLLRSLDERAEPEVTLSRYLAQIEPFGKDLALAQSEGVRVMRMGGSKGLTVRATIIAGLEDGLVPRPDGLRSEERRILYVAMTRAREYVFGTWARRRRGPTAHHGAGGTDRRRYSPFLEGGPVISQDGQEFILNHF